jgi:hypothetical protein
MKLPVKHLLLLIFLVILLSMWGTPHTARAVTWAEHPLLEWENTGLQAFQRNDFNKTMSLAQEQGSDPNRNAPLFIYYCHAQKYFLEQNRASAVYYEQQYQIVHDSLSGSNLAVLTRLAALPQVSWNKKVNKLFLGAAFGNAGKDEHLGAILFYLGSSDPEIAKASTQGLKTILERKRAIVMNGGTLDKADRTWMTDKRLLQQLVKMMGQETIPLTGFMAKLPAIARKKVMGGAPACLALIEEPALPMLRDAAAYGNTGAAAAVKLVQEAIGARLAAYPNSTWYSATGKQ